MYQSPKRILVVDDEYNNLEMAVILLETMAVELLETEEGLIIDTAATGADALIKYEENEYDLIISDLKMPDLSGIDLLKKIREKSNIPFIIMSGMPPKDIQKEYLSDNLTGVVQKPFGLDDLMYPVHAVLSCTEKDAVVIFYKGYLRLYREREKKYKDEKNFYIFRQVEILRLLVEIYKHRGEEDKMKECQEEINSLEKNS